MPASKVLFLGAHDSPLIDWLRAQEGRVIPQTGKVEPRFVQQLGCDFLISYGYRYLLGNDILDLFPNRAINLHISYLPWNRGADPNFWSFVDNTPKGVTIHHLDSGLDTGDIIVQEEMEFDVAKDTLVSSYEKLHAEIQDLFKRYWPQIKSETAPRTKQPGGGSSHKTSDKEALSHLLTDGWNTNISVLGEYAASTAGKARAGDR